MMSRLTSPITAGFNLIYVQLTITYKLVIDNFNQAQRVTPSVGRQPRKSSVALQMTNKTTVYVRPYATCLPWAVVPPTGWIILPAWVFFFITAEQIAAMMATRIIRPKILPITMPAVTMSEMSSSPDPVLLPPRSTYADMWLRLKTSVYTIILYFKHA